jgi:hypothetical protein
MASTGSLGTTYDRLPSEGKVRVIETLFDYYSFRKAADVDVAEIESYRQVLLAQRLSLPSYPAAEVSVKLRPPHEGQRPFLTRISFLNSVTHGNGGEFRFRPAYYDSLAINIGRPPNSSVRAFDTILVYASGAFWLRRLDLISIESLNISQTGLKGDGGYAWRFEAGLESQNLACIRCEVLKIETGAGKAFMPFQDQIVYFLVDARAQSSRDGSGHFALTPKAGLLLEMTPSGSWKSEMSIGYRDYIDDGVSGDVILKVENRLGLSRTHDFRLSYERHVDELAKVSFSYFW